VHFDDLYAVRLLQRDESGADPASRSLAQRMRTHLHPAFEAAVRDAIDRHRPGIVQVEHVELADLVRLRRPGERWVLDLHDAYGADDFDEPEAARRFVERTLPAYDAVTVCSAEDAALVRHARVSIVQNGSSVTSDDYEPSTGAALLFLGPFRYAPNHEGIRAFLREAYATIRSQVPAVSLVVLGGDEAAAMVAGDPLFAQPGVTVVGHREDIASALSDAALTINPLATIRGSPVKVIESLSAGRACVTTAAGARGFLDLAMPGLVVAPSVADMAAPIARLLGDDARRHAVERAPPEALAPFQWSSCARPLEALYESLLAP